MKEDARERLIEIAGSASIPFLRIARRFGVDYGAVLAFTDLSARLAHPERLREIIDRPDAAKIITVIAGAMSAEEERRKAVATLMPPR